MSDPYGVLPRIKAMAAHARSDDDVAAFDSRMCEIEQAGKPVDAASQFLRDLGAVILAQPKEDATAVRDAACAFIAQALGRVYGIAPDVDAVTFAVVSYSPKVAREVAAQMVRAGRESGIHHPFGVFRSRCFKAWNTRRSA